MKSSGRKGAAASLLVASMIAAWGWFKASEAHGELGPLIPLVASIVALWLWRPRAH